jgi:subtilase family serine protease
MRIVTIGLTAWMLVSGELLGVQRRTLAGHIPPTVSQLVPAGNLPATNELRLAIGLPLRNPDALTNLIARMYDPADSNYRRFLTPQEFTERFGPTIAQYDRVISFAKTNGLAVVGIHPNRIVLDVRGAVADIERAFHTKLLNYPHPSEDRSFYAPSIEPSVEQDVPILDITGLNNFTRPRPKSLRKDSGLNQRPKGGSGPNGDYLGGDFRAAYLPGVTLMGTGQIIGLLEFDGYYTNDITTYEKAAGLPNVPLENILLDGFDGTPTPGSTSGNSEVALNIELAISMAPGLSKVLVYEAGPDGYANDIISRMASDNLAAQLSCSWYFGIDQNATTEQIFLQFAAQGQSFLEASGDEGAHLGSIPFPDDNPYITIVGGTTLSTTGPAGSWVSETTWNAGGGTSTTGGFSSLYALPIWQQGVGTPANGASAAMRNVPDVAMVATNVSIVADIGQQYGIYGTSTAAPLWAGCIALVNQLAAAGGYSRVGFLNPAIYALAKGPSYNAYFHDITTGNNTNSTSANQFSAVAGYDLCTGWGSPIGQNLLNALAFPDTLGILPASGFIATGPVGGPFSLTTQSISLTNSSSSPLAWAVGNNAAWISASPSNGILAASESVTLAVALNASATSLFTGDHNTTLRFTNLTSGVIQSRQYKLSVGTSLVLNGGFESGDFSFWTLTAGSSLIDDGSAVTPHTGSYVAIFGQLGSLGPLTQTLLTRPGQAYLLSYWLTSVPDLDNVTITNEFRASFDSKLLIDMKNIGILDWTNMQFLVTASSSSTILEFDFRDDPYYLGLDDVKVFPVPAPSFQSITLSNGAVHLTWNTMVGVTYQLQYQSDLIQSNWNNLGAPLLAAGTTASASDPGPLGPARYYRVVLVPR